ncbi:MAG: flavin reductase family protein [Alphaproteobacteria bacterium]
MDIDFRDLAPRDRYKLLVGSVVPRPIALVSTVGVDGRMNAAPFSFFNAVSDDPPAVAVGVNSSVHSRTKDTARNIRDTGQFVVNLVDTALAQRMNICAVDFPPEVDEMDVAGLTSAACRQIAAPRIAEAPIALECRRLVNVEIGIGRNVVIGEVVHLHVRDDLIDRERLHLHADRSDLIGRMHGLGWYARTTDLFDMPRLSVDEVPARSRG